MDQLMTDTLTISSNPVWNGNSVGATLLTPSQLVAILKALEGVGAYGEVRLVVANGRIRLIQILQSFQFSQFVDDE